MPEYAAQMRAMNDMENIIKSVEEGQSIQGLIDAISSDKERAAQFVMFMTAYVHSVWEQLPQAGVMWRMAKDAMKNTRN